MTFIAEWTRTEVDFFGTGGTSSSSDDNLVVIHSLSTSFTPIATQTNQGLLISHDPATNDDILYFHNGNKIVAVKLNINTSGQLPSHFWATSNIINGITSMTLSPDGKYIIVCGGSGYTLPTPTIVVISTSDGTITDTIYYYWNSPLPTPPPPIFNFYARCARFDQSGNLLVICTDKNTGSPDSVIKKYSLSTSGILTFISDSETFLGQYVEAEYRLFLDTANEIRTYGGNQYRDLFSLIHNPRDGAYQYTLSIFRDYLSSSLIMNKLAEITRYPSSGYIEGLHYYPSPSGGYPSIIFFSTTDGLRAWGWDGISLGSGGIDPEAPSSPFTINVGTGGNGTSAILMNNPLNPINPILYYRNGNILKSYDFDFITGFSLRSTSVATIPNTYGHILKSNDRILCVSDTTGVNNIHVFDLNLNLVALTTIPTSGSIMTRPAVGTQSYFCGNNLNTIWIYGNYLQPTTTTTTSSTSSTTSTTTLPPTTTTTTTNTNTNTTPTTTTTTTLSPLQVVETSYFELVNGVYVNRGASDASDNSGTVNTVFAKSPTFGNIAPGQTSDTLVVALRVPYSLAITNIRLGLIETGGVEFSNTTFGITNSVELRDDIEPDAYFQGINSTSSATSPYNITIPNKDSRSSNYVYLNMKLPRDNFVGTGLVSLKWWFDYAD